MSESNKKGTTRKSSNNKKNTTRKSNIDKTKELIKQDELKNTKPIVKKETEIVNDTVKPKRNWYFSYELRLLSYIIVFVLLASSFAFLMVKYVKIKSADVVNYSENGKINYKVLLKDNQHYDDDYVDQGMMYVANLIDKIDIKFDYDFSIDKETNCNFTYDVIANLVIKDGVSDNVYISKKYDIEINNNEQMEKDLKHHFQKNVLIDYGYYNLLASKFKSDLGVDTESYLRVMINIKKDSEGLEMKDSEMYIDIPLSERAFNITISPMILNNYSQTLQGEKVEYGNNIYLTLLIVDVVIILFTLVRFVRLVSKSFSRRSKYQKYVAKLLREYDRLIVEVAKTPDVSNYHVIKISEFKELLDVRDNLKLPIMFHEITKNQKAYFYIISDNDMYLCIIKDADMQ